MILVTGGTGFIGNVLIRHLSELGYPVKLLLQPSKTNPNLPKAVPIEVALTSLNDEKGLRAALRGVEVIYHLAGAESYGREAQLANVDIRGTRSLIAAANHAQIERFYYLSHLGADRASAYPLLKAKAIAEHEIKSSGIPYTVFRSAVAFGEHDHFSNNLAFLLKISPFFVMLPDDGSSLLQPIWVEDLARVLTWSLEMPITKNQTIELGGPDYISFRDICNMIVDTLEIKRQFVNTNPLLLHSLTEFLEILMPNFPTTVFWLDYLTTNRTTNLDVLFRTFDLIPGRMCHHIDHLTKRKYRKKLWQILSDRKRTTLQWD